MLEEPRAPRRGPQQQLARNIGPVQPNMEGLSYEQYFAKVEEMVELMRRHWAGEQRVKTLKVIIQLTKLLADTSQLKLYPRKFKLIADCLDEFGRLVYTRVHSIASGSSGDGRHLNGASGSSSSNGSSIGSGTSNSEKLVPPAGRLEARELAKELCRNWFLKVASIRELVSRFYAELAILRTCEVLFSSSSRLLADSLEEQFFAQTLRRLTRTARGFGDPIVALHARAYLCKVAERLIGWRGPAREAILFELIFCNLKQGATLIARLDTRPALMAAECKGANRRPLGPAPSSRQARPAPASKPANVGELASSYFELLTSPMQSLLSVVTVRFDVYEAEDSEFVESASRRLARIAHELTDETTLDGCCAFRRNAILHSLFRALPNDIVAANAGELLDKFVLGYRHWQRPPPLTSDADPQQQQQQQQEAKAAIVPTIYATLTSLIVALDGSEQFERRCTNQTSGSQTNEQAVLILEMGERVASELLAYEQNRLSAAHLRCYKALLAFANHFCDHKLDPLLARFVERLRRGRQYVSHYASLLDIIKTLITNRARLPEFRRLFGSRAFCQLFELLRRDEHRLEAARWILESMRANIKLNYKGQNVTIDDRLLIGFLMKLFACINDSLSPLTAPDDTRHLCELVIFYLQTIAVGDPLERLEFHSQCRKNVGNLNLVLQHLVRSVLILANEHRRQERKKAARQNFLNGCLAFAFATTPAVADPLNQLELYQLGCELALQRMSLSLADYFMRQIMLSLTELLAAPNNNNNNNNSSAGRNQEPSTPDSPAAKLRNEPSAFPASTGAPQKAQLNQPPPPPPALVGRVEALLHMVTTHQDHVDLRHKLALVGLIENSSLVAGEGADGFRQKLAQLNQAVDKMNESFNCYHGDGAGAGDVRVASNGIG